jgi:hypothetical protein
MARSNPWTRRAFLEAVGRARGASAVYQTMSAMGLMAEPAPWTGPLEVRAGSGSGKTVLILGAGIAGLAAAYELTHAGFKCQVLEAQPRAGGRNFTARRGCVISEETAEHGATEQKCDFDEGLYVNLGPGRIPYHHRRMLHYCAELGVPLEIYVIETTANLFHVKDAFGGQPLVRRRINNDADAYIGELLSKAVSQGSLDQTLDVNDKENLLSLLAIFGDLQAGKPRITHYSSRTLRFRRKPSLPNPEKVSGIVAGVLSMMKYRYPQVEVTTDFRDRGPFECSSEDMEQLASILLGNAFEAAATGGSVKVRVRERTRIDGESGIQIVIADTGKGMSAEVKAHLFEPFFSTKDATGLGLGLWIASGIVRDLEGRIRIRSSNRKAGHGTNVVVFMPNRSALSSEVTSAPAKAA